MTNSSPNGVAFRVVYSESVRNRIKALGKRARQVGVGPEFLAAVKAVDAALRRSPETFGDPSYHLAAARLTIYVRIYEPLLVTYSVHRDKPIVFLRSIEPFPDNAF